MAAQATRRFGEPVAAATVFAREPGPTDKVHRLGSDETSSVLDTLGHCLLTHTSIDPPTEVWSSLLPGAP